MLPLELMKATISDCVLIHKMQLESFDELYQKYKDFETSPACESLDLIKQKMSQDCTDYYIIKLNNEEIGAIRVVRMDDNICRISPMFILPKYQGYGYAQEVIRLAESLYPNAQDWQLDTIKQENKLCYLYEKMGYKTTGKEVEIKEGMTIRYYSKTV